MVSSMSMQTVSSVAAAGTSARDGGITIRRAESLAEYEECVAIQEETWGVGFSERVPASILLVAQKIGGVVAVAVAPDGGRLLGFVFGLTGVERGQVVHWSDMLAVRGEARGTGIGERLKRHQRDLVRELGVGTMRWSFDPLVARNAHLNLARLGARASEYVPNMYGGNTRSPLHGAGDTDRLVASWDLTRVDGDGHGTVTATAESPTDAPVVNAPGADGVPVVRALPDAATVRIAVPHDVQALSREQQAAWRATTREAFLSYLARGYEVVGFHRGVDGELPHYDVAHPVPSARRAPTPAPATP
jgi:predicted GNAT superfamily acetyltransferase